MKSFKFLTLVAAMVAVLAACDNGAEGKWKTEKDSLMTMYKQQQQTLDELTNTIVEISSSLDSIAVGEELLKVTDEGPTLTKQKMLDNLAAFKAKLSENKARLANLEKQIADKDNDLAKLGKLVKYLRGEMETKELRIAQLEEQLSSANANIELLLEEMGNLSSVIGSLQDKNSAQRETIEQQDEALNTGYYIISDKKALKEAGLLKSGDLKYEKFDKSLFTKIDIRKVTRLNIPNKKAKILTGVPNDSYTLERNGKSESCTLTIYDVERFWSVSKYLIIEIN